MMASIKIAIVAFSAPPFSAGGVASAHYNLFRAMRAAGFEARLFTFGDSAKDDEKDILRSGTPNWIVKLLRGINKLLFGLLQPGKRAYQSFDILSSFIGARRMNRAIQHFDPHVIILSDHGAPGLALERKAAQKIILVSHHNPARFLEPPAPLDYSILDARLALSLEQKVISKTDAVVCPSQYMLDWFERTYTFDGPRQVIPNVLDEQVLDKIPAHDIRHKLDLQPQDTLIYIPSAGSHLKGDQALSEIVKTLIAAGKSPLGFYLSGEITSAFRPEYEKLARSAHLYLPGQLPYEEHIAIVKSCSFGVSPSLMENYSMALLEAVLLGLPMLAFETGGNADIIHSGENGYLVPPNDVKALCEFALSFMNKKTLSAFSKRTLKYSRQTLASQKAMRAYADLIMSL